MLNVGGARGGGGVQGSSGCQDDLRRVRQCSIKRTSSNMAFNGGARHLYFSLVFFLCGDGETHDRSRRARTLRFSFHEQQSLRLPLHLRVSLSVCVSAF